MRSLSAILLVVLLLARWAGDCWHCHQVVYALEVYHDMNATEAALARQLDVSHAVREVAPEAALHGGYAIPGSYVFSEVVDGDTLYYLLLNESQTSAFTPLAAEQPRHDRPQLPPVVSLGDFFPDYLFPKPVPVPAPAVKIAVKRPFVWLRHYVEPELVAPAIPPEALA